MHLTHFQLACIFLATIKLSHVLWSVLIFNFLSLHNDENHYHQAQFLWAWNTFLKCICSWGSTADLLKELTLLPDTLNKFLTKQGKQRGWDKKRKEREREKDTKMESVSCSYCSQIRWQHSAIIQTCFSTSSGQNTFRLKVIIGSSTNNTSTHLQPKCENILN